MGKRRPGQLPLDAAAPKAKGVVERYTERDLRELRGLGTIPTGMAALEAAYRLAGREIDRAEAEQDRYGKLTAMRELRALRERLGVIEPVTGTDADGFWAELSSNSGDGPPAGPADAGPPGGTGPPGTGPDAPAADAPPAADR